MIVHSLFSKRSTGWNSYRKTMTLFKSIPSLKTCWGKKENAGTKSGLTSVVIVILSTPHLFNIAVSPYFYQIRVTSHSRVRASSWNQTAAWAAVESPQCERGPGAGKTQPEYWGAGLRVFIQHPGVVPPIKRIEAPLMDRSHFSFLTINRQSSTLIQREKSQLLDGFPWNSVHTSIFPSRWIAITLVLPRLSLVAEIPVFAILKRSHHLTTIFVLFYQ